MILVLILKVFDLLLGLIFGGGVVQAGTAHNSEGSQVQMSSSLKVLNSEGFQVRRFSSPKVLKSENQYNNYMCALKPVIGTLGH